MKENSCVQEKTRWRISKHVRQSPPSVGIMNKWFLCVKQLLISVSCSRQRDIERSTKREKRVSSSMFIDQIQKCSISSHFMHQSVKKKPDTVSTNTLIQKDPTDRQFTLWLICVSAPNTESLWRPSTVAVQLYYSITVWQFIFFKHQLLATV